MVTKKFSVKDGIKTGGISLDGISNTISAANLVLTNKVSAVELAVQKVSSNIIPATTASYDLGSVAKKFNDLYLANSVTIGTHTISATATGVQLTGELTVATGNIETINATDINTDTINVNVATVNHQLVINSTIDATSTDTGSIVTAGGVGIMKDLYVGGSIHLANNLGGTTAKSTINYNDGVSSIDFNFNG